MTLHRLIILALLVLLHPLRAAVSLTSATIADLQAAFAAGSLTSEKVTELYLARIAACIGEGHRPRAFPEAPA